MKRSDGLNNCLDLWRHALPDNFDPRASTAFNAGSVACVLLGKGFYRQPPGTGTDLLPRPQWERYAHQVAAMQQLLVAQLPDHAEALAAMVDAAETGKTAGRKAPTVALPTRADAFNTEEQVMAPDMILARAVAG